MGVWGGAGRGAHLGVWVRVSCACACVRGCAAYVCSAQPHSLSVHGYRACPPPHLPQGPGNHSYDVPGGDDDRGNAGHRVLLRVRRPVHQLQVHWLRRVYRELRRGRQAVCDVRRKRSEIRRDLRHVFFSHDWLHRLFIRIGVHRRVTRLLPQLWHPRHLLICNGQL